MPDLHGWITQQIEHAEKIAREAGGKAWHWEHDYGDMCNDPTCPYGELATDDTVLMQVHGLDVTEPWQGAARIAFNDPATVLRRCTADRKILERHRLNPNACWADAAMCEGCGTEGEMGYARTENLNDCPELLDLAEGYGLIPEILATLVRPERGPRPEPGPGLIPAPVAEAIYGRLFATVLGVRPAETPQEKAINILNPELKKVAGYVPIAEDPPAS